MRKKRSGVSLLEVLVACVILMVSVGALTSQALVGVRAAKIAQLQAMATVLCRSMLEEQSLAHRPVSSTSGVPGHTGWVAITRMEPVSDPLSKLDRLGDGQLYRLSVTVWQDGRSELISKVTLSKFLRSPVTSVREPSRDREGIRQ